MSKKDLYNKYETWVVVSTIITLFLAIIADKENGYEIIYLIPFSYLILFILNKPMHKYSKMYKGMLILNGILYIKYVVAIFFIIINEDYGKPIYTGTVPSEESCMQAIIYILIEMIFIFATVFFLSGKFYKNMENDVEEKFEPIKINILLMIFLLVAMGLALTNFSAFMPTQTLFIDQEYAILQEERSNSLELIFFALKTILMGLIINQCIVKYQESRKTRYVFFSYITILIHIILNTSTSRINMILPIVFFVMITYKIFGKKGRVLLGCTVFILILSVFSITIYKNAWLFEKKEQNVLSIVKVLTSSVQEYTSGIRPVAQGIEAILQYKKDISFSTFFNDIFGAIPIVNKVFDNKDRINIYYNRYILGNTTKSSAMIMPMVTISAAYFSKVFCWLLSVINIILLMYFDGKEINYKKNYLNKYMMLYLTFVFASSIYANTQIIIGRIFTKFIPVVLIMYINYRLTIKKENKYY